MKTLSFFVLLFASLFVSGQSITVTYPNGNHYIAVGSTVNCTWTTTGNIPKVKIEFYTTAALQWVTLQDSVTNTGTFAFQIPAMANTQGKIRVSDPYNVAVTDESNVLFNILNTPFSPTIYGDTTICAGHSIVMGPWVQGGTPPYTYQWAANPDISNLTVATPVFTPTGTHPQYTVTVTDNAGASATLHFYITVVTDLNSLIQLDTRNGACNLLGTVVSSLTAGGTVPLTYAWSNGGNQYMIDNLTAGNYTVTITDGFGCQGTASTSISLLPNLELRTFPASPTCTTQSLYVGIISNAVYPVTYNWSNGGTTNTISPASGTYAVTVVDNAGCTATASLTKPSCSGLQLSTVVQNVSCFGSGNGAITATGTGGTTPYQYSIDGGTTYQSSGTFNNLLPGAYTVLVKDATNATISIAVTITEPQVMQVNSTVPGDGILPDTLDVQITGGTPPYTYGSFYPQSWTTFPVINQDGIFLYIATDANGCYSIDTIPYSCINACVWPGDANYDGLVDNNDLLPIGLAYGNQYFTRFERDIDWYAHVVEDWPDTLADGTNYKHIDCDGWGSIDANDTLAILQNFSLIHPRSGGMAEQRGGLPMLHIDMVPDTLADGETVVAHLILGDSMNIATSVYGLAFTFNFDPLVVDTNEVSIAYSDNSWLCNNAADHIDIDKPFLGAGQIKTAVTRIDHAMRSGNGEIATVSMKITTGNINGKNLAYYGMQCYISDLTVIDNAGNLLAVDPGLDSAIIEYEPTGIADISRSSGISIYPNPATNVLNITSSLRNIGQFVITNLLGKTVITGKPENGNHLSVNTSQLAEGVYIIRVLSGKDEFVGRFVKQ